MNNLTALCFLFENAPKKAQIKLNLPETRRKKGLSVFQNEMERNTCSLRNSFTVIQVNCFHT